MAVYLIIINAISTLLVLYDKYASKNIGKARIPERLLLAAAVVGGSIAMYLVMLLIRHKTKHVLFMAGLPIIIAVQLIIYLIVS